jgi:hypothetical protein
MTEENAGSLAGDLEERFQRICQRQGRLKATVWFWWAFLCSLPPIIIEDLKPKQEQPQIASSTPWIVAVDTSASYSRVENYVGDECLKEDGCQGSIRWSLSLEDGSHSGYCQECGANYIKCGNCGKINVADDYACCGDCLHDIPLYC